MVSYRTDPCVLFRANKKLADASHSVKNHQKFFSQKEWTIHLIFNDTCDGNEFELRHNGIPVSAGHTTWECAFNAIPEQYRSQWN